MNSIKNLFVVILLMGVSWGAFQVINAPDPTLTAADPVEPFDTEPWQKPDKPGVPELPPLNPPGFDPPSSAAASNSQPPPPADEELTLPELEIREAPETVAATPEPATPEPATSPRNRQPTSSFPEAQVTYNEENGDWPDGDFQPQPQTELQPVEPRTDTNLAIPSPPPATTVPGSIDWNGINRMVATGDFAGALTVLSGHYDTVAAPDEQMRMRNWLDELAGKVIYSTEDYLEPQPHVVTAGETLESLANQWQVPASLIYNINRQQIPDRSGLVAGTRLKVVRGPFQARISLAHQELTLFLNDMYAGRFVIELGTDHEITPGEFVVETRTAEGHEYHSASGQVIAAGATDNPYGKYWIGFRNSDLCIHAAAGQPDDLRGGIRMSSRDAADLCEILSDGSRVSIMR